eukprot:jgi/Undpi1/7990/HiC_scaffold_24.g10462.m1
MSGAVGEAQEFGTATGGALDLDNLGQIMNQTNPPMDGKEQQSQARAQSTPHGPRPGPALALWCTRWSPVCPAAESRRKDPGPEEKEMRKWATLMAHRLLTSHEPELKSVMAAFREGKPVSECVAALEGARS